LDQGMKRSSSDARDTGRLLLFRKIWDWL